MKYLIVGLGNIGEEYWGTRHNIGFRVVNALAEAHNAKFEEGRYGATCEFRVKNQILKVLKPNTYMNLSGNAVRYWMQEEQITIDHVLIVCDDIALPFGTLRMRPKGSAGGHNGLKDIAAKCGGEGFARLRFGVGGDFPKGAQVDWVLGHFPQEEEDQMPEVLRTTTKFIEEFCLAGAQRAMNKYNGNPIVMRKEADEKALAAEARKKALEEQDKNSKEENANG